MANIAWNFNERERALNHEIMAGTMIERLGIIGDLHGEHRRLDAVLDFFAGQSVDALICTGDVADGRGCINRCCELLADAEVLTVAGNHDRWLLEDRVRHVSGAHTRKDMTPDSVDYLERLPRWRRIETLRGPLLLCHGVEDNDLGKVWPGTPRSEVKRSAELDALLERDEYRYLINGHMHFRVLVDFENLLMVNAGTLKGDHAGVSLIDFAEGSVAAFSVADDRRPSQVTERSLDPGGERRVWKNTAAFDGDWEPVTLYG